MIGLKSDREIAYMKDAGRVVAEAHSEAAKALRPGIRTKDIDIAAENIILKRGAIPSFKGYNGFPASTCISIDNEVVHGIPGERRIIEGSLVSIDIGAIVKGYHGDAARSWGVGQVSGEVERLLKVAEESLKKSIEKAQTGNRLSDISNAIQKHAEANGYSVVRNFVGHGIGKKMHEEPQVPNFGSPGKGPRLQAGMVLAIEPMVNAGTYEVSIGADNWTVTTLDEKLSAHFEDTVAITNGGPLVLTDGT
jgi:methionyl aminopeptidase